MAMKDALNTFFNYVASGTGLLAKRYDADALKTFSPEEQSKVIAKYRSSLNFSKVLPSDELFDNYLGIRATNADVFSKIATPDGSTIALKLNAGGPGTTEVKGAITNALKITQKTTTAKEKFASEIAEIKKGIKKKDANFLPGKLEDRLYKVREDALKAIITQHTDEKTALEANFSDPVFLGHLETSLGIVGEAQQNKLKKDMLHTLGKSHNKELESFDKSMSDPLTEMHKDAQIDRDRIALLAMMRLNKNNSEFQEELRVLAQKAAAKSGSAQNAGVSLGIDGDTGLAILRGIDVKDLHKMQTLSGLPIANNGDGSFSIQLPHRLMPYYQSGKNYSEADIMSLVLAIKACSKPGQGIEMYAKGKNPETAKEIGRNEYKACRLHGYESKDIKIMVEIDGKMTKMSGDELFADCPSLLQEIEAKAAENATARKTHTGNERMRSTDEIKQELNSGRAAERAAAAQAAAPAAVQAPPNPSA